MTDLSPKYRRIAADAARLYRDGHTLAEVGRRLSASPNAVKQALRFMGVPLRPAERWGQTPLRDAVAEQVRERYLRGDVVGEIAAELEISRTTVENMIDQLKLPRRQSAENLRKRAEEIVRRRRHGEPVAAIAANLKISARTVYDTLNQHGKGAQ